jgi:hypothetical protein
MEISPSRHRNMKYEPWFEERATLHSLKPGDALHMPYLVPHWVSTGKSYSISMAMTWKTPEVLRQNKIRLINGTMRDYGFPLRPPGASPAADAFKVLVHDGVRLVLDPLRRSERLRILLRRMIYGKQANYYLKDRAGEAGAN